MMRDPEYNRFKIQMINKVKRMQIEIYIKIGQKCGARPLALSERKTRAVLGAPANQNQRFKMYSYWFLKNETKTTTQKKRCM